MPASYLAAWLLPLFAGSGVWWLAHGARRARGDVATSLGAGFLIGLFIAASCARWTAQSDTAHAWAHGAPWLFTIGTLSWIGVAVRGRNRRYPVEGFRVARATSRGGVAARVGWWLLLVVVALRFCMLVDEASLRPVFPWDAWSAWAIKPKSWMLLGHADAYVSMQDWLAHPALPTRTAATWNYPELLAWIEIWFASAAGGWNEPMVDVAWAGALGAFALVLYGQARRVGLAPWVAMASVYAWVSLPLVDAHVALAGYADLWIAVTLGVAALAWARWVAWRERGQWLIGIGLALCLPAIKLEGGIWLLLFAAVVALDRVPSRWRVRALLAVAAALAAGFLIGGLMLPMLGLGWAHVAWGSVRVPQFPPFELAWHPVGAQMLASLFLLPNWHLLWYALPLLVAVRWRQLRRVRAARLLGLLLLLHLALLFVLFFFTGAAAWAADYTSANRLILQIVPLVFAFAIALLQSDGRASIALPTRSGGIVMR